MYCRCKPYEPDFERLAANRQEMKDFYDIWEVECRGSQRSQFAPGFNYNKNTPPALLEYTNTRLVDKIGLMPDYTIPRAWENYLIKSKKTS